MTSRVGCSGRKLLGLLVTGAVLQLFGSVVHAGGFLFDGAHYETAGNADWIVDADLHNYRGNESNAQAVLTPSYTGVTASTSETYWNGALSAWGVAEAKQSRAVSQIPTSLTGTSSTMSSLTANKVLVVCEPNNYFSASDKLAMMNFVAGGGGLFIISDHDNSDRNSDGVDSVGVWNDFFTNSGIAGNPLGITVNKVDLSLTSTNMDATSPLVTGAAGTATSIMYSDGATFTIDPTKNSTVKGAVWTTGTKTNANVMMGSVKYGLGNVVFVGDSSVAEDGTGDPNDTLYFGWDEASHSTLLRNASDWLFNNGVSTFATATTDTWSNPYAWAGAIPDSAGAYVVFPNVGTSAQAVTVDHNRTVGTLVYKGTNAVTISGTSTLTLQGTAGGSASILSQSPFGSDANAAISAPLALTSPTVISFKSGSIFLGQLKPTAQPIELVSGFLAMNDADIGSLTIDAANNGANLNGAHNATVDPAGSTGFVTRMHSLTIAQSALVYLHPHAADDGSPSALIIDYDPSDTSPLATIQQYLHDGRLATYGGDGTYPLGYGEASTLGLTHFLGWSVDSTSIVIRETKYGDATLDGVVDFNDLLSLAKNYGATDSAVWTDGDFDGNGTVDFDDLLLLAKFYGQGQVSSAQLASLDPTFTSDLALAQSLVPEPMVLSVLSPLVVMRRRRRA